MDSFVPSQTYGKIHKIKIMVIQFRHSRPLAVLTGSLHSYIPKNAKRKSLAPYALAWAKQALQTRWKRS